MHAAFLSGIAATATLVTPSLQDMSPLLSAVPAPITALTSNQPAENPIGAIQLSTPPLLSSTTTSAAPGDSTTTLMPSISPAVKLSQIDGRDHLL